MSTRKITICDVCKHDISGDTRFAFPKKFYWQFPEEKRLTNKQHVYHMCKDCYNEFIKYLRSKNASNKN